MQQIPTLCDRCRAEGHAGDALFADLEGLLDFEPVPVRRTGLNGERLGADDASYDCVLSTFTLCTIPDVTQALSEVRRVLQPGGVLIMETPNPDNILVGSHTFYHDPTHLNPLTPTAMSFLLRYCGFDVEVRRFNPYPESAKVPGDDPLTERVNGHLCGPQDFAVVGIKAVATDASSMPRAEEQSPHAAEEDGTHASPAQEDKT